MILLLFLFCVAALAYLHSQRRPKNFPPGPWGFPLLGHLPLLGVEPHKTVASWVRKYGPIVGVQFGSFPCVIITDFQLAKEAFAAPAFLGRPTLQLSKERAGGVQPEGIIFTQSRTWHEQRGFAHRRLRELGGFGTREMEAVIQKQVQEFVHGLEAETEQPISTLGLFNVPVVNSLWAIIAGRPFKQNDRKVLQATRIMVEALSDNGIFVMLPMFLPWFMKCFPTWITRKHEMEKLYKPMIQFLQPFIDEHQNEHVFGQPRDFIDAYIDEIKATTDPTSSFHATRARNSLTTSLLDLFAAGTETVATTLAWTCLLMARYPDVQERLAAEIQAVVGAIAPASLRHRKSMQFTEAVLHEVMRFRTLIPLGVFHSTTEPVHFHGFDIPKDTMVFINIHEAHNNRELWGDPENFRPERWLVRSEDGSTQFVRRKGFLAFSTGRRVCLGEQMGRDELFLFTVGLFQKFSVKPDPSAPAPTLDPKLGGTTQGPKPHRLVFMLRDIECQE